MDEITKNLELSTGSLVAGHNAGTIEIEAIENEYEEYLREVDDCINSMDVFTVGILISLQM